MAWAGSGRPGSTWRLASLGAFGGTRGFVEEWGVGWAGSGRPGTTFALGFVGSFWWVSTATAEPRSGGRKRRSQKCRACRGTRRDNTFRIVMRGKRLSVTLNG